MPSGSVRCSQRTCAQPQCGLGLCAFHPGMGATQGAALRYSASRSANMAAVSSAACGGWGRGKALQGVRLGPSSASWQRGATQQQHAAGQQQHAAGRTAGSWRHDGAPIRGHTASLPPHEPHVGWLRQDRRQAARNKETSTHHPAPRSPELAQAQSVPAPAAAQRLPEGAAGAPPRPQRRHACRRRPCAPPSTARSAGQHRLPSSRPGWSRRACQVPALASRHAWGARSTGSKSPAQAMLLRLQSTRKQPKLKQKQNRVQGRVATSGPVPSLPPHRYGAASEL